MTVGHSRGYWMVRDTLVGLGHRLSERDDHLSTRCPAHDDRKPSLDVRDVGDTAVLFCHAGCDPEQVLAALGLSFNDLYDKRSGWTGITRTKPRRPPPPPTLWERAGIDVGHLYDRWEQERADLTDPGWWLDRAAEWHRAAPQPGDFTGHATVAELNTAVRACRNNAEECLARAWALAPDPDGDPPPPVHVEMFTEADLIPSPTEPGAGIQAATDRVRAAENRDGLRRDPRFWLSDEELRERRAGGS